MKAAFQISLRHLTVRMSVDTLVSTPASANAWQTLLTLSDSSPETSPRVIEPLLVCRISPGTGMDTPMTATPGTMRSSPKTSSSTASLSTPFWTARTVV